MQAPRGTFLQLPSVFIETCDLPETAQIMYIRMLHKFGYKNVFVGSIRKLATIVRMPKSTVDRMLDVLAEVKLLKREHTTSDDTERDILKISLDTEDLWQSNTEYCNNQVVPNWDKGKKKKRVTPKRDKVSHVGTNHSQIGIERPNVGQSVPTGTLKEAPNITKTSNIVIDTRERESLTQTAIPPLASSDASLVLTSQVVVTQKQETNQPQEKPVISPTMQTTLLAVPLTEPDMTGAWNAEKCVQYAEWCNGKRYTDIMRPQQLAAAQSIHVKHKTLTLQQFKQAYDERNDAWWQEKKKGKLHVSDMHAKGNSGVDRVSEMLERIEGRTTRKVIPMLTTSKPPVDYRNIMPPRLPSREQRKREVV